jgi:hypothetical protein
MMTMVKKIPWLDDGKPGSADQRAGGKTDGRVAIFSRRWSAGALKDKHLQLERES